MTRIKAFTYRTMNEEKIEEFEDFIEYNNLLPLFTNEHNINKHISIGDNEMTAVLKQGGKYRTDLIEFGNLIAMANDNKMYESAMFKVLYNAGSFVQFMKRIRKISDHIKNDIWTKHLHNTWNIVWYTKEVY